MNCANHPDRERAAFCQHCGKPLCDDCVRKVGTSVYCEPCLAARVHGPAQPAGFPYAGYPAPGRPAGPPPAPGEPSPGLAALLGLIPGVGAMYNEQYGKGIVHLIVFAVLVSLSHDVGIFGLFVAGWMCYMVVEAYHTARARRDGTPLPNPFGLNDISERLGFGRAWPGNSPGAPPYAGAPSPDPDSSAQPAAGGRDPGAAASPNPPPYGYGYVPPVAQWAAPQDSYAMPPTPPVPPAPPVPPYPDPNLPYYRRLPSGAIWLIALGVLFLVGNIGVFHVVPGRLFGPLVVIGVGVWMFVHRMTSDGGSLENDGTPLYRWRLGRAMSGAAWVVLVGVIWLLDVLRILRWSVSWPLFLIAGGVLLILRRAMVDYGPGYPIHPTPPAATTAAAETAPGKPPGEPPYEDGPGHGQEGR